MREKGVNPESVGADKGYHQRGFVAAMRERDIKPHVAPITGRDVEGLDGRTLSKESYRVSQRKRKLVEQCFGFAKTVAGLRKSRLVGIEPTGFLLNVAFATLNLVRIAKLAPG